VVKNAPDAAVKLRFSWRINGGTWATGKEKLELGVKGCDLVACKVEANTPKGKVVSKPAEKQLAMGTACGAGNACAAATCAKGGGCAFGGKAGACEDGDACTTGDTCDKGVCKAGKKDACTDYYKDNDGDGFGSTKVGCLCGKLAAKTVAKKGDCADDNKDVFPGQTETCDGVDDDCDGKTDEDACGTLLPPGTDNFKTNKPMKGDTWEVDGTATIDGGPFGPVDVAGKLKKAGKDKPVTWCMTGAPKKDWASKSKPPFSLTNVKVNVCKDDKGALSRTFTGDIAIEGGKGAISGTFSTGKASGLVAKLGTWQLLGRAAKDASIAWKTGEAVVTVQGGDIDITYMGQKMVGTLGGQLEPDKAAKLQITVAKFDHIKMTGGIVGIAVSKLTGTRTRAFTKDKAGKTVTQHSTQLVLSATILALTGATVHGTWRTDASRIDGGMWALSYDVSKVDVAPFKGLNATGKHGEGAKSTCIEGVTKQTLSTWTKPLTFKVCWGLNAPDPTFSADADIAPIGKTTMSGTYNKPKDPKAKNLLCLSGEGENHFPAHQGKKAPISARLCLDLGTGKVSAPAFSSKVIISDLGKINMKGTYTGGVMCMKERAFVSKGKGNGTLEMRLTRCADKAMKTAKTFATTLVDVKPFGKVTLLGEVGKSPGQICFAGKVPVAFAEDSKAVVTASQCWSLFPLAAAKSAPQIKAVVNHKQLGSVTLTGTFDAKANGGKGSMCLRGPFAKDKAAKQLPLKGVTVLGGDARSCHAGEGFGPIKVAVDYRIGKAAAKTAVVLRSSVDFSSAAGICVTAHKTAASCLEANRAWIKLAADPSDRFGGRYAFHAGTCIDKLATDSNKCATSGSWKFGASRRAATTAAPLCLKKGAKSCDWAATCDTNAGDKTCSATWQPFWAMPIGAPYDVRVAEFGAVKGNAWVHGGKARLDLTGSATSKIKDGVAKVVTSGSTTLIGLKKLQIRGHINEAGMWSTAMQGRADLNLTGQGIAAIKFPTIVQGVPESNRIVLRGNILPSGCNASKTTCTWPTVQPFKKIVGDGVFESTGKGGDITILAPYSNAKTVDATINFESKGSIKIPGGAKQSVQAQGFVEFRRNPKSGDLYSIPVVTFAVPLGKNASLKIAGVDVKLGRAQVDGGSLKLMPTVFLASTEGTESMQLDLDNDPSNGKEAEWRVDVGATIRTTAVLPHFQHLFKNPTATIDVSWIGLKKFELHGKIDVNWTLVKPEYNIPTLNKIELTDVFVKIKFPGTVRLYTGGHALVETIDRKKKVHKLKGTAQFEMVAGGGMGGTIALSGMWYNPFYIPNVAVFNVGLSARFIPGVPVPTAFGYTGQALLLKDKIDAPWPKIAGNKFNTPVGVNKDGTLMNKLPGNVFTYGETIYLDTVPSKSGFCILPSVCPKMPELLVRFDLQNIGTDDLVDLINLTLAGLKTVATTKQIKTRDPITKKEITVKSPWAALFKNLPLDKALKKVSFGPLSMTLDRFWLYMHTHSEEVFGIDWPFGFKLAADARFKPPAGPDKGKEKKIRIRGNLDVWGATLQGWISPLQVIPGIKLTADPFRRQAALKGGYVRIPGAKGTSNWGTFEGWFQDDVLAAGNGAAVFLDRRDSKGNGIRIATDEMAIPCEEGAINQDGSKRDCKTKLGRVVVTMRTSDGKVPAAARTRVIKSKWGVIQKDVKHHLAIIKDPKTHEVRIFLDGGEITILDSADGKDGKPATKDDLKRFALPDTTAQLRIGQNFQFVDDLRLWTDVRGASDIERRAARLEKGYHIDKTLIGRWEIDFDNKLGQKLDGKVIARNSRLDKGDAWHGRYEGASKPDIDPKNQDLWFRMDWPIKNPLHTGWGIKAGMDIKLPKPLLKLSGNPEGIAFAAELNYHGDKVGGKVYARELTVIPIPTIGGFVLYGDGPDARPKNWDDGLFAELEMRYPTAGKFDGESLPMLDTTARLAFDWKKKRQQVAGTVWRMGCLKKDAKVGAIFSPKPCSLGNGYHFYTKTVLGKKGELAVDLGKGLGKLGITGIFELSTLDAPLYLNMRGNIIVFGKKLIDVLVKIDRKGFQAKASLDLGINKGVNLGVATTLDITYDWNPARLCAKGNTEVKIPVLATVKGNVEACFGTNPMAAFEGKAKAGKFGSVTLADIWVKLHSSKGLEIKQAKLKIPSVFDGDVTGFYKGVDNFDLSGKVETKAGTGKLFKMNVVAHLKRIKGQKATTVGIKGDMKAANKWITGRIEGQAEFQKNNWYYALAGDANLKPMGFKMASARAWLCKPYNKKSKSIPSECKTKSGLGMSGTVNIGIAKVKIGGGINTGVKVKDKGKTYTVDRLYLEGSLNVNLHKVFKYAGKLKMGTTEPFVGGHNYLEVSGKISSFGMSTSYSKKLQSGADGLPKPYELKASGTLKPFSGWSLASGNALFKYEKPGKTTMSAGGTLNLSPILKGSTGATIKTNGSATWTGKGKINLASLLVGDLGWTLSTKGTSFNGNFKADTKVLTLGVDIGGTIPKDLKFAFNGKGWTRLYPFPKADFAKFAVSSSKGFEGEATLDLKIVKMKVKVWAGNKATGIGVSGAVTLSTWKIGTFIFKWVEEVTKTVAKKLSGCSCSTCGSCWGGLPGFRCKCKETKSSNSEVKASVTFKLSGTSYKSSSTVKLSATAKLTAGKWSGSSTTSCSIGSKPKCCFKFVAPIGTKCLNLY